MGKYDKFNKKKPQKNTQKNPKLLFQKANLYLKKFDYDKAIEYYREFLSVIPNSIPGMNMLGICHLKKQNSEKAKSLFLKVIKRDPSFFAAYNNLGLVFMKTQEYEKGKYYLKQALKINPKYENAWLNLAQIASKTGDSQGEINFLEKLLEINPGRNDVMNILSNAYQNAGEYDKAINLLDKIEKAPSDSKDHPSGINLKVRSIQFKNEQFFKDQHKDRLIPKESVKFAHKLELNISPQLISKDNRAVNFSFSLKMEPDLGIISFSGQAILESPNQEKLQSILFQPLPARPAQQIKQIIARHLLFESCKKSKKIAYEKKIPFPSEQELFSQLFKERSDRAQKKTVQMTRPIVKRGNFARLKSIPSSKIITEITLANHPNLTLVSGNYRIEKLLVELQVSNGLILTIQGKIVEPEYDPKKIPESQKPIQPEIPDFVTDVINDILTQSGTSKEKLLEDTNWTKIIVNYKVKDKVIASIEYPKTK